MGCPEILWSKNTTLICYQIIYILLHLVWCYNTIYRSYGSYRTRFTYSSTQLTIMYSVLFSSSLGRFILLDGIIARNFVKGRILMKNGR